MILRVNYIKLISLYQATLSMYNTHKMTRENDPEEKDPVVLVRIPTLAGSKSNEAPVLLVDSRKAAEVASMVKEKDKERKQKN